MDAKPIRSTAPSGFTLVELLVVIVIIGILASLISAAAVSAVKSAKRATITTEMDQLSTALENYKQDYGDYPPDFVGVSPTGTDPVVRAEAREAVFQHLRKAFPRYALTGTPAQKWSQFRLAVKQASLRDATLTNENSMLGLEVNNLDAAGALVFWLGGPRDLSTTPGATKLVGFSANPMNPFAVGGSRLPPLFELDETRLVDDVTRRRCLYVPPHVANPDGGLAPPYVYFRARLGGYNRNNQSRTAGYVGDTNDTETPPMPWYTHENTWTCFPYADKLTEPTPAGATPTTANPYRFKWLAPKTFQIICAGLDGEFGPLVTDPTKPQPEKIHRLGVDQNNIDPSEDDNLASFTKGTLADGVQ